jgi:hypothetical protein
MVDGAYYYDPTYVCLYIIESFFVGSKDNRFRSQYNHRKAAIVPASATKALRTL